jgi:hypothetical protein
MGAEGSLCHPKCGPIEPAVTTEYLVVNPEFKRGVAWRRFVSDQRIIQFPSHDTVDLTGEEVLSSLRRVADVAEQNIQRAVAQAHHASMQLRAAEDKIARLEQEMGGFKERAERAEAWLRRISQEIDQTFPARQPDAYAPRRSNTGR